MGAEEVEVWKGRKAGGGGGGLTGQFVSPLFISCNMNVTVRTLGGVVRQPQLPLTPV